MSKEWGFIANIGTIPQGDNFSRLFSHFLIWLGLITAFWAVSGRNNRMLAYTAGGIARVDNNAIYNQTFPVHQSFQLHMVIGILKDFAAHLVTLPKAAEV